MKYIILAALSISVVNAQSGRQYGPGRIWWEAGKGGALALQEEYDDPTGLFTRMYGTVQAHSGALTAVLTKTLAVLADVFTVIVGP